MARPYKFGSHIIDAPSNDNFQLHFHDHYEIYLFLEGDTKYIVEENVYTLEPLDMIVIRKHQMHRAYHNSPTRYNRIVLRITPEFFQLADCAQYEQIFLDPSRQTDSKINADTVRASGLYNAFMRAEKYSEEFGVWDSPILRAVTVEILYLLNHIRTYSSSDTSDPRLKEVITYLNSHYTQPITLDWLAQRFYLSKYHLCHIFSERTGLTVHQYITNKRLTLVEELIKEGTTISEAAELAGFNHYSSFYRAYKKSFGITPKKNCAERVCCKMENPFDCEKDRQK